MKFKSNEENVCPVCNCTKLRYSSPELMPGQKIFYEWTCEECGARGKEIHHTEFCEQKVFDPDHKLYHAISVEEMEEDDKHDTYIDDDACIIKFKNVLCRHKIKLNGSTETAYVFMNNVGQEFIYKSNAPADNRLFKVGCKYSMTAKYLYYNRATRHIGSNDPYEIYGISLQKINEAVDMYDVLLGKVKI